MRGTCCYVVIFIFFALVQGRPGDVGGPGYNGDAGHPGQPGREGQKGELGEKGYRGMKGEIGHQGLQGSKGNRGPVGVDGPAGPSGDLVSSSCSLDIQLRGGWLSKGGWLSMAHTTFLRDAATKILKLQNRHTCFHWHQSLFVQSILLISWIHPNTCGPPNLRSGRATPASIPENHYSYSKQEKAVLPNILEQYVASFYQKYTNIILFPLRCSLSVTCPN